MYQQFPDLFWREQLILEPKNRILKKLMTVTRIFGSLKTPLYFSSLKPRKRKSNW